MTNLTMKQESLNTQIRSERRDQLKKLEASRDSAKPNSPEVWQAIQAIGQFKPLAKSDRVWAGYLRQAAAMKHAAELKKAADPKEAEDLKRAAELGRVAQLERKAAEEKRTSELKRKAQRWATAKKG